MSRTEGSLSLVDTQRKSLRSRTPKPERHVTAHPEPSLAGGKDLVSDAFAGKLAFVLEQNSAPCSGSASLPSEVAVLKLSVMLTRETQRRSENL